MGTDVIYAIAQLRLHQKEKHFVRSNFNHRLYFADYGITAHMVPQPSVGLLPEWRVWLGLPDSDHPGSDGKAIRIRTASCRLLRIVQGVK